MNRLLGTRTYLAGAMDRCPDGGGQWRDRITPELQKMGIVVVDPRFKPIDMGKEDAERRAARHIAKEASDWDAVMGDRDIRTIDLRCVDVTDYTIAYINMDARPWGTVEEITLANRQKKPIISFVEGGKKCAPDWLFWMTGHEFIFGDMEEALNYLRKIDSGELTHKRFVLFDWEPLIQETMKVYRKYR